MNITMRAPADFARSARRRGLALAATIPASLAVTPLAAAAADSRVLPVTAAAAAGQAGIDGWLAIGAVTIGAFLAVLYIRGMYLILHYAAETYDVSLDQVDDAEYSGSGERKLLSIGSVALVVLSALIIASYGLGWPFLYIGPALSLLGPIVIIASMESDVRKYRRVLDKRPSATAVTRPNPAGT